MCDSESNWLKIPCPFTLCAKTVLGNDIVTRACVPKLPGAEVGCNDNSAGTVCWCDGDNCNGAMSMQTTVTLTIAAAVMAKIAL